MQLQKVLDMAIAKTFEIGDVIKSDEGVTVTRESETVYRLKANKEERRVRLLNSSTPTLLE